MKTSVFALLLYAGVFLLHGCSDADGITGTGVVEPTPTPPAPRVISGAVQKGPFIVGTLVYANRLSAAGQPTSDTIVTSTQTDIGTFAFELSEPGVLQLFADGYHFNEITGSLSQGRLTLNAILDATSAMAPRSYVNVLTHLTYNRTLSLLRSGMKAPDAIAKAQSDLVNALHPLFPANNLPVFTDMSVYNIGDSSPVGNAYLLAVSATAYQTAITRARVSGTSVDAELTLLLNTLADDMAQDGDIDDRAVIDELIIASRALDPDAIRFNLKQRSVKAINAELAVADLNLFIDTDGDGIVNSEDPDDDNDNIADALDPQPYVKVVVTGWITSLSPTSVLTGVQVLIFQTNDARLVANVEYLVNGEVVGQASAPPYSFAFNPYFWGDEGKADISVRVTDIGGNVTVSQPISVAIAPEVASLLTLTPSNGAVLSDTVTPTLSWVVGGRASKYEVQLWDQWTYAQPLVNQLVNDSKLTSQPLPVGTYQWRVRAGTPSNNWGPWTAVHNFTLIGPKPPLLNFPANATSVVPGAMVKFDWSVSLAAAEYQLQISRTRNFDPLIVDLAMPGLNYSGSFEVGKHYWRVRSKNVLGFYGEWSEVRTFGAGLFAATWNNFYIADAMSTPDGGVVAIGDLSDVNGNGLGNKVVRLDDLGNIVTEKILTSVGPVLHIANLVATADGGYIALGWINTPFGYDAQSVLIKTDAAFNELWVRTYSKTCDFACWPDSSVRAAADGFVILGNELWKTDLQGNVLWSRPIRYRSSTFEYVPSQGTFALGADGSSYIAGTYEYLDELSNHLSRTYLMRVNADGTEAWRHFGDRLNGRADTFARLSDGSFLLVDQSGPFSLEKYDAAGMFAQEVTYFDFYDGIDSRAWVTKPIASAGGGFYFLRLVGRSTPYLSLEVVRINSRFEIVGYTVVAQGYVYEPTILVRPDGMLLVRRETPRLCRGGSRSLTFTGVRFRRRQAFLTSRALVMVQCEGSRRS